MLRVPFVRRSRLEFDDGTAEPAFTVNINVLGAYLARDAMPRVGQSLTITFRAPDRERDLVLHAIVTWVNPRQQHPVHSLPPGFGVKFPSLEAADRRRIESIVDEYIARNPQALR
jgi:Tfp pilus assembly protein PilZ